MSNPNPSPENRFAPGNAGGPGRPPDAPAALKQFTKKEIAEVVCKMLKMTIPDMIRYAKQQEATALEVIVSSVITQCVKKGDYWTFDKMIERVIGKVPQKTELTGADGEPFGPTPAPIIQFVPLLTEQNEEKPALPDPGEINQTGVGMGQPDTGEQPCNANVERIPDVIPPEIDEMDDPPYFPT